MMRIRAFIGRHRHPFRVGQRVQSIKHPGRHATVMETWRAYDSIRCTGVRWHGGKRTIHYLTDALERVKPS